MRLPSLRWIILGGLVLRLAVFALLPDQHFPDAAAYADAGIALFHTGRLGADIYMPLYPILSYLTGGGAGQVLFDIALSTASIALVYHLSLAMFDNQKAAALAALGTAAWPHFLFYAVSRLTETLFILLLLAALLALYHRRWALGSVLLVLGILTRPAIDLLAPVLVLVFAVVVHRQRPRTGCGRVVQYLAIYVVLMSPWWFHNYQRYGEFVRLNLGDGIMLYAGNNPMNQSGGGVAYGGPGDDVDLSPFAGIADPIERNRALRDAAATWILAHPDRFLELAALKFVRFWRLWPYASSYQSPAIIVVSLGSYGVALALSVWFLLAEGRRYWRPLSPPLLFTTYLTAVHMVTNGSVRYRLPIEPFLIILAASVVSGWLAPRRSATTPPIAGTTPAESVMRPR